MTRSVDSLAKLYRQLQHQKGLVGMLQVAVADHDSSSLSLGWYPLAGTFTVRFQVE
jgi:hypothetical protein